MTDTDNTSSPEEKTDDDTNSSGKGASSKENIPSQVNGVGFYTSGEEEKNKLTTTPPKSTLDQERSDKSEVGQERSDKSEVSQKRSNINDDESGVSRKGIPRLISSSDDDSSSSQKKKIVNEIDTPQSKQHISGTSSSEYSRKVKKSDNDYYSDSSDEYSLSDHSLEKDENQSYSEYSSSDHSLKKDENHSHSNGNIINSDDKNLDNMNDQIGQDSKNENNEYESKSSDKVNKSATPGSSIINSQSKEVINDINENEEVEMEISMTSPQQKILINFLKKNNGDLLLDSKGKILAETDSDNDELYYRINDKDILLVSSQLQPGSFSFPTVEKIKLDNIEGDFAFDPKIVGENLGEFSKSVCDSLEGVDAVNRVVNAANVAIKSVIDNLEGQLGQVDDDDNDGKKRIKENIREAKEKKREIAEAAVNILKNRSNSLEQNSNELDESDELENAKINESIAKLELEIFKKSQEIEEKKEKLSTKKREASTIDAKEQTKEEAKKLEKEMEILKKDEEILKTKLNIAEGKRNKNLDIEEVNELKLDLQLKEKERELLKENNETKKKKIQNEIDKIKKIQNCIKSYDTRSTQYYIDVEKKEYDLAKKKREELVSSGNDKAKKADEVQASEKKLVDARKKDNKSKVKGIKKTTFFDVKDGYLYIEDNNNILEKLKTDINSTEFNYFEIDGDFYRVDSGGHVVDGKGKKIDYNGYNFRLECTTNGTTVMAVDSSGGENTYSIDINNKKVYDDTSKAEISDAGKIIGFLTANKLDQADVIKEAKPKISKTRLEAKINDFRKKSRNFGSKWGYFGSDLFTGNNRATVAQGEVEKEVERLKEEANTKSDACGKQQYFLGKIKYANGIISDEKLLDRLESFSKISDQISELSQNFDYGNPDLNKGNIKSIEGLINLIEKREKLLDAEVGIEKELEEIEKDKSNLNDTSYESLKGSLKDQKTDLEKAYETLDAEMLELSRRIEQFRKIDEITEKEKLSKIAGEIEELVDSKKESLKGTLENLENRLKEQQESRGHLVGWKGIKDLRDFDSYIKKHFKGNREEFFKYYDDNNKKFEENDYVKSFGGTDKYIKTIKGEVKFAEAVGLEGAGYKIKEVKWYSSRQNKILAAAQETYNKNVTKIDRLNKENESLKVGVDPFEGSNNAIRTAIGNNGIHLPKTRKEAGKLFDEMKADCIKKFFDISDKNPLNKEMEEAFEMLESEVKTVLFQKYLNDIKTDATKMDTFKENYSTEAINLVINTFEKKVKEVQEQVAVNNEAIKAIKDKNLEIVKETKNIVDKKLNKVQYKKEKQKYKSLIRENTIASNLEVSKMVDNLRNKKKELDEKKKEVRFYNIKTNEMSIKYRGNTFRKNVKKNRKNEIEIAKGNLTSLNLENAAKRLEDGGFEQQYADKLRGMKPQGSAVPFP